MTAVPTWTTRDTDALVRELLDAHAGDRARVVMEAALPAPAAERGARADSGGRGRPVWLAPGGLVAAISERAAELAIADTGKGERVARLAIELAGELGLASVGARARVTLGHVLNYATRFGEALAALEQAAAMGLACGDAFAVARAALVSMHALARLGRMDEAVAAGARAISGFEAIDEPVWRAKTDVNLGVLKRMRGDAAGAVPHFEAARVVFADAPAVLAQIESNRAEALLDLARFGEAEGAFGAALVAFTAAGATHAAGIAEGNLADLLSRKGRFEGALEHFERARRALEGVGAPADLARLQSEEGDALGAIGMDEEAARSYRRAIAALDEAGLAAEGARARVGLAHVLERLGKRDEADRALGEAIGQFAAIPNATGEARARVRQVALRRGMVAGERLLDRLDELTVVLAGRPLDLAEVRLLRCERLLELARGQDALAEADGVLEVARALVNRPLECDALAWRARAVRATGGRDEAIATLGAAIEVIERIRGSLQADRFRAAAMGSRHGLYEELGALLLERAAATEAAGGPESVAARDRASVPEVTDRGRARALLDLVHGGVELAEQLASGASEADRALVRELAASRGAMNALYDRLFNADGLAGDEGAAGGGAPRVVGGNGAARRREEAGRALEEHERRVAEIERRLAATRRFRVFAPEHVRAEQVQSVLREDEALVEYAELGGVLHAMVLRHVGAVSIVPLARTGEVVEAGQRLAMCIDRAVLGAVRRGAEERDHPSGGDAACMRVLERLHAALIAPIEAHLGGVNRLLVSPHDSLHGLPLHAVRGGGTSLIERFEVVTTPSAALLYQSRMHPHQLAGGMPLVVGVPDEVAPQMGEEARAVAGALGRARLLVGTDATFAAFAEASGDAPLIHLACHGAFAARNPMQTRVRFSDAWVTVRDVLGLSLPGSVVVLSGCETGRAGVERGGEAYGLGRALLATGASAVVMSLWPVHDRTTRELMESVYQGIGRGYLSGERAGGGMGVARHLAAAQRGLIARGVHPAMWAPFVMMGDPGP